MHDFLLSAKVKKFFDSIFDFAIGVSILWLAIVVIISLIEPVFGSDLPSIFARYINLYKITALSLNTLIMVKIYKLLYHFIGDHSIKLIDLFEIAITALVITKVFDHNTTHDWFSLVLLIVLIVTFIGLHWAQKKKILQTDETHE